MAEEEIKAKLTAKTEKTTTSKVTGNKTGNIESAGKSLPTTDDRQPQKNQPASEASKESPQNPQQNQSNTDNFRPQNNDEPLPAEKQKTPQMPASKEPPSGATNSPPASKAGGPSAVDDKPLSKGSQPAQDISHLNPVGINKTKDATTNKADAAKDKLSEAATDKGKQAAKQVAKKLAKQAAKIAARYAAIALSWLGALVGPYCLIIGIVIFVIIMLLSVSLSSYALDGHKGQTLKQDIPPASQITSDLQKDYQETSRANYHKIDLSETKDKEAIDQGKIDNRLAEALHYLAAKHERIQIDHIISGYVDMPTNPESGADSGNQVVQNISAHKKYQAADLGEIDFVFKAYVLNPECESGFGLGGIGIGIGGIGGGGVADIVYYNDLGNELLRQKCQASPDDISSANSTYLSYPADAIPISVRWQDDKPTEIKWLENIEDPSETEDSDVFYQVYRPEAQRKVHQVIAELLQFPIDKYPNDLSRYRVIQLETFSQERDVDPFDTQLDKIYGDRREPNFGLFSMREAWAGIHIGY